MNYTDTLSSLNQASAFDLFRLRAAIDRVLDQPGWMSAVQARLRVGQVAGQPAAGQLAADGHSA